ncbi:MAG: molybdopterin-dependent oxidoreductase [Synergistaceae bacterium]|nr:molybdopterin-dependent oxidoreductase [Synergistaceae bacterium]
MKDLKKDEERSVRLAEIKPLFALLSELLLYPPSRERWGASFARCARSPYRHALPGLDALAELADRASEGDWRVFEEEYRALFWGLRFPSLDLWESCFRAEDRRLMNRVTFDAASMYRKAGLRVDESLGQPPDHIGAECAFFSHLCGGGGGRWAELAHSFFELHLRHFAEAFGLALEERAREVFYATTSRLLRRSAALLSRSHWVASDSEDLSAPPICLRPLIELEKETRRKSIPICGTGNCGGRCPLTADAAEGCVLRLGPSNHPDAVRAPGIKICARGASYHRTFLSGARLRYPLRRVGERGEGRFERVSWEAATEIVAAEADRIGRRYGPQSRYVNYSSGVNAVARGDAFAQDLLALNGGFLGKYNTYSTACTSFTTPYTYGTNETGNCSQDLLNSKLIVLWGHNPMESVFGSSLMFYLREAKKSGIEILVVDPRFSDTASALADRWIGLRPTTDGALMDAMAYTILEEGLQDQAFMDRFCLGFDASHMLLGLEDCENYRDYAFGKYDGTPKTAEWAADITGVDPDTIRWLARRYAQTKPAALLQGYGPQRNGNGEQIVRSGTMLACLTGNVGIPGGSACGNGAVELHRQPGMALTPNPYSGKIPSFLWTDAVFRGTEMTARRDGVIGVQKLDANIKMIWNLAGNTLINQHSDVKRTAGILRDTTMCEFIVCSDLFMTPSARFADILLPGTSMFEGDNIGKPWREGDYILYCNKAIEPLFECRFEYDWLSDVARHLGCHGAFTRGGKELRELLREVYEGVLDNEPGMPDFDAFRGDGIYRYRNRSHFIAFEKNIRDPENHPFPTPSGKIEIFSPRLHDRGNPLEIPAIPKYVPSFEGPGDPRIATYPFQLIGWHTKRRTHSTHDNNPSMEELAPHRVWINLEDAEDGNIREDDWVNVFNDRGSVRIRAHVTDRVIRGVLAISQGGWYAPDESGVDIRGCVNTLSTARPTPLAKGNPQHSNLVNIALCEPA